MLKEQQEDMNLIANILTGDLGSQNLLYLKYKKIVEDFIKYNYPLNDNSEDDVSEILTKMFFKLKTYDSYKSEFKTWICRISKNHMIDKWRSNSSIPMHVTYDLNVKDNHNDVFSFTHDLSNCKYEYGTITHSPEFENNDSINYISKQLSPDDFTMLDMKYVKGYNYQEIGELFNVTSSTVSNRVNYVKSKLKKENSDW